MVSYVTPKKNSAFIIYIGLPATAAPSTFKSNPTIASGDFQVSTDGGALANLTTLPTVTPASSKMVKISLSAAEMNGDNVTVVCSDAAGAEWNDVIFNIQTSARQVDDLAYPATTGRSIVVDAAGLVDANMVKCGPTGSGTAQTAKDIGGAVPAAAAGASGGLLISGSNSGTTTLGALTVTGTATISDGLVINRSTSNSTAVAITGSGSGKGMTIAGGAGATTTAGGDGLTITGGAGGTTGVPGNGVVLTGGVAGSTSGAAGHGVKLVGGNAAAGTGAAGDGLYTIGGTATSTGTAGFGMEVTGGSGAASTNGANFGAYFTGGGTNTVASSAHGMRIIGTSTGHGLAVQSGNGSTGNGIHCNANSTNGEGFAATGTGSSNGILATGGSTSGAGIKAFGTGTGHGILAQSGSGATGDGIKAIAGSTNGHGLELVGTGTGSDLKANTKNATMGITGDVTGNLSGSVGSVTAAVTVGTVNSTASNIKKNTALSSFMFLMTDSTTHAPKTGATITATRSIDGAAFGACANSAAEVANGTYKIDLAAADLNGNNIMLRFTATGADDRNITLITQP